MNGAGKQRVNRLFHANSAGIVYEINKGRYGPRGVGSWQ